MGDKSISHIDELDTSVNLTLDETPVNVSELLSESSNSILEPEQSFVAQQDLYGTIKPSPLKAEKTPLSLPKLNEKLVLPKQRKRSNSMDAKYYKVGGDKLGDHKPRQHKRPSTCGKEGQRNFSTPLPSKIESLNDMEIPTLSPETSITNDDSSSLFDTPVVDKTKFTSPLSVRCFSTPLADLRTKAVAKTAVQIKLHQLSSKEYIDEHERQLQREILKYQSEVNTMKKIKKYRDSKEDERLDQLIEKWRDIAERGSNHLYNQARMKIERMGGIEEFRKKQQKSKLRKMKFEFDEGLLYRIEEYMDTDEFKNLEQYEKEEVISRRKELEKMSEQIENGIIPGEEKEAEENHSGDEGFTMEELYKQMNLDYKLVFGP